MRSLNVSAYSNVAVDSMPSSVRGFLMLVQSPTPSSGPVWSGPGRSFDLLMAHKASFVVWLAVTGIHVLGRLVPAVRLLRPAARTVPGRAWRALVLGITMVLAVVSVVVVLGVAPPWHSLPEQHRPHRATH
jgi:hypothetical protein